MVLNANNHYVLDDFKFRFLRGNIVFLQGLFTTCFKKSTSPMFFSKKLANSHCYCSPSAVGLNMTGAIVLEVVLTFVFVMTILGVTSSKKTAHMAGIVIGFTLTLVHIIGVPLTGTSVNPARSLAPAIFAGGDALAQVWVFIVAPLIGAALAAVVFKSFFAVKEEI
jgi:glycerol uptake facilitator-like aquaporin